MFTASPIKIGQYQTYKPIKNKNSNLIENKTSISNFCYPTVYFTSNIISSKENKKSPTNTFMLNNIKTFYNTPEKVYNLTNHILNEDER